MKIFGWMQSKFNGRQAATKKPNMMQSTTTTYYGPQESCKEEFSDWPNGLLAIGTFGNNNELSVVSSEKNLNAQLNSSSSQSDCTNLQSQLSPEEKVRLQRELNSLLCDNKTDVRELETSLEVYKRTRTCDGNAEFDDNDDDDSLVDKERACPHHLQQSSSIVVKKGSKRDVSLDRTKKAIGKRSLSFLLKKMFVCNSGFSVPHSLRDPLLESRMEKILRSLIHKKVYPQSASTAPAAHKYLDKSHNHPDSGYNYDEIVDKESESGGRSKWVKTDSEYIVLEI